MGPQCALLTLLTCATLVAAPNAAHSQSAPAKAVEAAQRGLDTFITGPVSTLGLQRLGFATSEEASAASIGPALDHYVVSSDSFLRSTSEDVDQLVDAEPSWQFIVLSRGEAKCIVSVAMVNGEWAADSVGAAPLAIEALATVSAWPHAANYSWRLITIWPFRATFVEVFQTGRPLGLVPLVSARTALGMPRESFDPRKLVTTRTVMTTFRRMVTARRRQ